MTITNCVETHAPSQRHQFIRMGTLGLAALSLALLVYGFVQTGLDPRPFWSNAGLSRFQMFAAAWAVLALGTARTGPRYRLPALGTLGFLWLLAAFGVGAVASVALIGAACLAGGDLLFGPRWRARFGLPTAGRGVAGPHRGCPHHYP